jgi:predicted ATP-grasp superfamily ATP-dependent carboligase
MTSSVLILDGETRTALAATRALGKCGVDVWIAASSQGALSFSSKFASRKIVIQSPQTQPEDFSRWLREYVSSERPSMLLPVTDASVMLAARYADELTALTGFPFSDAATLSLASNKGELADLAKRCGLAVPQTLRIARQAVRDPNWTEQIKSIRFPAVLKPETSAANIEGRLVKISVEYAASVEQAIAILNGVSRKENILIDFIVQEQISGAGVGVFALCHQGNPLTFFCHRRLLEKPPSGGVSVLSESISPGEAPVADAFRLLRELTWEGVAMLEFKAGTDGKMYLLEINPRLWGSLQLAIDSGRDFPQLLTKLASCQSETDHAEFASWCRTLPEYSVGRRLRWVLGTLDHALIRLRKEKLTALSDIFLRNSLRLFERPTRTGIETWRASDQRPFYAELQTWVSNISGRKRG